MWSGILYGSANTRVPLVIIINWIGSPPSITQKRERRRERKRKRRRRKWKRRRRRRRRKERLACDSLAHRFTFCVENTYIGCL